MIEDSNIESQTTDTQNQGTSTQLESTNPESNTKDKGKARQDNNTDTDSDTESLDSTLDNKLTDNFDKIRKANNNVLGLQKILGLGMSETEQIKLESERQISKNLLENLYKYAKHLNNWQTNLTGPTNKVLGKVDKAILDSENVAINKLKECSDRAHEILENSEVKPLHPRYLTKEHQKNLQKYSDYRNERDIAAQERYPLVTERLAELKEIIKNDDLKKRKRDELQEQQPENQVNQDTLVDNIPESSTQQSNKKARTSLLDDYADPSQEFPDYTGGDD